MFYKVIKNGKVIDVLSQLCFVKYQPKHDVMVSCGENDAQGILSSDCSYIWHWSELPKIPKGGYDTVDVIEIDKYEYEQLKMLNGKSAQEIIDEYTLFLVNGGLL